MATIDTLLKSVPTLQPYARNANHVDVYTVTGQATMREFLAGAFSYEPGWLKFLYHVRGGFVRLLGMKQDGIPEFPELRPEDVSMTPGEKMVFFTVEIASEDFWLASIKDTHLKANLGVVSEAVDNGNRRFHFITIVHYLHWTGVVYFNVIRPFHYLVVAQMAKAAVRYPEANILTGEPL
jgi:hypothetical protein